MTTAGFGDILRIGYQNRPRLFDLAIKILNRCLSGRSKSVNDFLGDGEVLVAANRDEIRQFKRLHDDGIESLAICLMHAYRHSQHEELIEQIAREIGFCEASRLQPVAPFIKIVSRGDTTVVDAYLTPVLRDYVATLRRRSARRVSCDLLTSAGGLNLAEQFSGKDCILSGPAWWRRWFSRVAQAAGFQQRDRLRHGWYKHGRLTIRRTIRTGIRDGESRAFASSLPMMAIETVAAGAVRFVGSTASSCVSARKVPVPILVRFATVEEGR